MARNSCRCSCAAVLAYLLTMGGGSPQLQARGKEWDGWAALTLQLTHRDFAGASGSAARAVLRSSRRAAFLDRASSRGFRTPVYAEPGAFVTSASLGSPSVPFTAVVDTGSDLVWRQCTPCTSCFHQSHPIFHPPSSSTYQNATCSDPLCTSLPRTLCPSDHPSSSTCTYVYAYGDFSYTSGELSYDTLTLSDALSGEPTSLPHFGFGCGHSNAFSHFDGADGLIGLGQGPLSLPSQLGIPAFSYCLQTVTDPDSKTSALVLGQGASFDSPSTISTPLLSNSLEPTLYYIGLKGISVGGKPLSIPSGTFDVLSDGTGGMIIDSGSTLTYLVTAAYNQVLDAFNSSIRLPPTTNGALVGLDLCYKEVVQAPSLTFHFDGGSLTYPVDNYFFKIAGLYCLAMTSSIGTSIYGNIQQQNHHILYNRQAKTISFTPTRCDSI